MTLGHQLFPLSARLMTTMRLGAKGGKGEFSLVAMKNEVDHLYSQLNSEMGRVGTDRRKYRSKIPV